MKQIWWNCTKSWSDPPRWRLTHLNRFHSSKRLLVKTRITPSTWFIYVSSVTVTGQMLSVRGGLCSGVTGKPVCLLASGCDGGRQVDDMWLHQLRVAFRDTGRDVTAKNKMSFSTRMKSLNLKNLFPGQLFFFCAFFSNGVLNGFHKQNMVKPSLPKEHHAHLKGFNTHKKINISYKFFTYL